MPLQRLLFSRRAPAGPAVRRPGASGRSPWLAAAALALGLAGTALPWPGVAEPAPPPPPPSEPGAMLRSGVWRGDVGVYALPDAYRDLPPRRWPVDGWTRLQLEPGELLAEPVPVSAQGRPPAFMASIVDQLLAEGEAPSPERTPEQMAQDRIAYLRVPGLALRQGRLPLLRFPNGRTDLVPVMGRRYALSLDGQPFAITVTHGLRNRQGVAYGSQAQVRIEYGGQAHGYSLGEHGWNTTIQAITDLDGDGRPDVWLRVGVPNGSYEALLLSSRARPGPGNPATASMFAVGC